MCRFVSLLKNVTKPSPGIDPCIGFECPAQVCRLEGTCFQGECSYELQSPGTACDDGNPNTVQDMCREDGTCAGIDLCAGVNCTALSQCHVPGTCDPQTGQCSNPFAQEIPCDDNNPATDEDTCNEGECMGIDFCLEIECDPPAQCRLEGVCMNGVCSYALSDNFSPCDDGNSSTVEDSCQEGVCVGINNCFSECMALDQCHVVGECEPITGECSNPIAENGLPCDDQNPNTVEDACSEGVCIGVNKCLNVTCEPAHDCIANSTCDRFTGECVDELFPATTPCDDGNSRTVEDQCNDKGVCFGIDKCDGVVCSRLTQCHFAGECDIQTGICSDPIRPNGTKCDDDNDLTDEDQCFDGVCRGKSVLLVTL